MFLEYLKGACKENGESGTLCDFCSIRDQFCEEIERGSSSFPGNESGGHHYLALSKTQTIILLKAAFASGQCSLDLLWLGDA